MGVIRHVTDAIVLTAADSREDKIVTFLSPELGRVAAVARQGRKSTRRFGAHIQPITHAEMLVKERPEQELGILERASAKEGFAIIKADLTRYALATTMAEVVLHLIPVHGREPGAYNLLLRAFSHLNRTENQPTEDLLFLFQLKMLAEGGVLPEVQAIEGIPPSARLVLQGWLDGHWASLTVDDRSQVAPLLDGLVQSVSGRLLKSRSFLNEMLHPAKHST